MPCSHLFAVPHLWMRCSGFLCQHFEHVCIHRPNLFSQVRIGGMFYRSAWSVSSEKGKAMFQQISPKPYVAQLSCVPPTPPCLITDITTAVPSPVFPFGFPYCISSFNFMINVIFSWAATAQSVRRLARGWTVWGSISDGYELFCTCPDGLWGPHSVLYNGYRVSFTGVKWPGRGFKRPPYLVPRLKKE